MSRDMPGAPGGGTCRLRLGMVAVGDSHSHPCGHGTPGTALGTLRAPPGNTQHSGVQACGCVPQQSRQAEAKSTAKPRSPGHPCPVASSPAAGLAPEGHAASLSWPGAQGLQVLGLWPPTGGGSSWEAPRPRGWQSRTPRGCRSLSPQSHCRMCPCLGLRAVSPPHSGGRLQAALLAREGWRPRAPPRQRTA